MFSNSQNMYGPKVTTQEEDDVLNMISTGYPQRMPTTLTISTTTQA